MQVEIEVLKKLIVANVTDDYKVHKITDSFMIFYDRTSFANYICEFYKDSNGEPQIFDSECIAVERTIQEVWLDKETNYQYIV